MIVELPWPHRDLSPNARVHRMAKARLTKKARVDAGNSVLAAGIRRITAEQLKVTVAYAPPTAGRYDMDNLIARSKAFFDGVADVIGVDDSRWSITPIKAEPKRPHGAVTITIEVVA